MLKKKLAKFLRDPNVFFEDYFAKRRRSAQVRRKKWAERKLGQSEFLSRYSTKDNYANVTIEDKTILYESFDGKSISCNPLAIFRYLVTDSAFNRYTHVWVVQKPSSPEFKSYKKLSNVKLVAKYSSQYWYYLRAAKYLINNNTFPSYFSKQPGQIYVNTQHGVPIKTMGKHVRREFGFGANVTRNLLHVDFLVMPNSYTADTMLKAHDVETLFPGVVVESGYPRFDLTQQSSDSPTRIRQLLEIPAGRKVLLYAPTYRGTYRQRIDRTETIEPFVQQLKERYSDTYHILCKSHHIDAGSRHAEHEVPPSVDINEILGIVDVLVTDYSSLVFDFLPMRRPILYFAYDLDEYRRSRGLYIEPRELPGTLCKTADDVFRGLDSLGDHSVSADIRYEQAIERYCPHDDGFASKRVADALFGSQGNAYVYPVTENNKRKILFYGGGFLNNGVTSSVSSLLKAIDQERFDLYLAFNRDASPDNVKRLLSRVPENVKILYYLKSDLKASKDPLEHAQNEVRRLFGSARFDVAVEASGYGKLWPGMMAQVQAELRCIYLHNCMRSERELRPNLADYDYIFGLYASHYDVLINVSQSSFDANAEYLPHVRSKMIAVDNLLDYGRIVELADERDVDTTKTNFINVGRYDYQKGQECLVLAFKELHEQYPDTHLYLVGHGPDHHRLEGLIERLEMTACVKLTGALENPFRLLRLCDCFVLSSHYEGQGIALLEAMVLGVPCISTDIPGPRSVLDKQFLYEDSKEGLLRGMRDFMEGRVPSQSFDAARYNARSGDVLNKLFS